MKKNVIKYIIVILAVVATVFYLVKSQNKQDTVGRIDISTALVNAAEPQFEVYVDGSETPEKQADWMHQLNEQGYVVEKEANKVDIIVKVLSDSKIKINLRGKYQLDGNNEFVPVWVDFTSLTVDGEEILKEATPVWHNKAFLYTIDAKAGQDYKVSAKWTKHEDK